MTQRIVEQKYQSALLYCYHYFELPPEGHPFARSARWPDARRNRQWLSENPVIPEDPLSMLTHGDLRLALQDHGTEGWSHLSDGSEDRQSGHGERGWAGGCLLRRHSRSIQLLLLDVDGVPTNGRL